MTQHPSPAAPSPIGDEPYRPHIHFTPRRNWINDPNGLVFFEGEYHLFYQYNPQGSDWGHMSWGHAVSPDLAHWRELPVAIPETDRMIFSGSIVVDWENVSVLGDGAAPPLLAYFTAFDAEREIQSQHLAYSHDRGRTFAHYAGNPILDLDHADFRDPKVFRHADSAAWIMVVALAKDHVVQIYRSIDLLDWRLASTFGPAGSTAGQWECPDLVEVPIEGEDAGTAWVMKVDVDEGLIDGGSGAQYFVGSFDGHAFAIDPALGDPEGDVVDHGPDFYAAITWAELPETQPGPVWIGWQSNHQSGRFYPTDPWRGAMSLPRRLFLYRADGRLRLGQEPVLGAALAEEAGRQLRLSAAATPLAEGLTTFEATCRLVASEDALIRVTLADAHAVLFDCTWDRSADFWRADRTASAKVAAPAFHRTTQAPLRPEASALRIVVDGPLVEIFVDDGRVVYTATLFPDGPMTLAAAAKTGDCAIDDLRVRSLSATMLV